MQFICLKKNLNNLKRNKMKKEFIPYKQALLLKELGFDEPCLGYYTLLTGKIGNLQKKVNIIDWTMK